MARHRSPQGRRAHLEPPLLALVAAAGAGGARPIPLRSTTQRTSSLPTRFVATALAGGALAAAGQHALAEALPVATDGANVLRIGVEELLGTAPVEASFATASAAPAAGPLAAVDPIAAEPVLADAAELVKAAELQRLAAEAAARAEEARLAEEARAAAAEAERAAKAATLSAGGGVQMVIGRITSGFGARWGSQHQGLDIAAPIGTPIRVPLDGTVIDSGPASGFGLWVRVRHDDGTVTVYGHINRSLVSVGEQVAAGEVIAEVGNRGQSTGPHLHFEVITPGGTKINPLPWLNERGIGLT